MQSRPEHVSKVVQRRRNDDRQQADQQAVFDRRGAGPVFDKALNGGDHSMTFLNALSAEAPASTVEVSDLVRVGLDLFRNRSFLT